MFLGCHVIVGFRQCRRC